MEKKTYQHGEYRDDWHVFIRKNGMFQENLAKKLGLTRSAFSRYMNGKTNVNDENQIKKIESFIENYTSSK